MKKSFATTFYVAAGIIAVCGFVSQGLAAEDDGTPYKELARRLGPQGSAAISDLMNIDYWGDVKIREQLNEIEKTAEAGGNPQRDITQCRAFNDVSNADGIVDVRIALGYFDNSDGTPFIYGNRDWGKSSSSDEAGALAIRKVLTSACPNVNRRLCGFEERTSAADRIHDGQTLLTRDLEIQGRQVEVRITLSYSSASPFYERNTGVLKAKQDRYTQKSEENFFGGLRNADYAFYVGHSRNGGGPDFNPPRLNSVGKADYAGYYRKVFPGRDRMLRELNATSNKNVSVGLFSCDSNLHFRGRLLGRNPKQRAILTIGTTGSLDYFDVLRGPMSYLEGILRGTCGASLEQFSRPTAKDKTAFQQYNLK